MRAFFASILLLASISGCRAEGACAIDSDCPIRFRCAANVCTALGTSTPLDAGPARDASAVDVGLSLDVGAVDAPLVDAGPTPDANQDAPLADAFVSGELCPALVSDYSVSSFSRGCFAVSASRVSFMRTGATCAYTVSSDDDVSGTLTLTEGTLTGPMTVGTRSYLDCTVTERVGGQVTIACGTTCTVALLPLL